MCTITWKLHQNQFQNLGKIKNFTFENDDLNFKLGTRFYKKKKKKDSNSKIKNIWFRLGTWFSKKKIILNKNKNKFLI